MRTTQRVRGRIYLPKKISMVRRHERRDGRLKEQLTRAAAESTAAEITARRGLQYNAYPCQCGYWHVGQAPRQQYRHHEHFFEEVGDRVMGCIRAENNGTPQQRLEIVTQRWRAVRKRLGVYD